ncbi:MAG: ATP-binding protein, partial [Desulfovermiculus sp.]
LRILSVNNVYHQLFADAQPEGKFCHQVFHRQDHACAQCPVLSALQEKTVCRGQGIKPARDMNRSFDLVASPMSQGKSEPSQVLLFMRDVTREKKYQVQFMQAEKMATVGVLAAGVAHEINNPLTSILGFSDGLKRRLPRLENKVEPEILEDMREYVQTIRQEGQRCQEIVQNLLTFSRPRNSPFGKVNLRRLITDCLKIIHYRLKKCPLVDVQLNLDSELPFVHGDEAQLKQVVLNLLTNALDALSGQGVLRILVQAEPDNMVSLEVEDSGPGIPPEYLERVFDPFFTTKPVGEGTGIGLSTCYNIVQAHSGRIYVCSEPEKGSSFRILLPLPEE